MSLFSVSLFSGPCFPLFSRFIEAMGGELDIVARFPDGAVRISNFAGIGEKGGRLATERKSWNMTPIEGACPSPNGCTVNVTPFSRNGVRPSFLFPPRAYCKALGHPRMELEKEDDERERMRRYLTWTASAACLAILSSCGSPERFDLLCHFAAIPGKAADEPLDLHFRIDLKAKQICSDSCPTTDTLDGVDDNDITVMDSGFEVVKIDRRSGKMIYSNVAGEIIASGNCERQRFSGFPKRRF